MTVLVTGGGGLVGSHVIEALRAAGEQVQAFVGDVTDPAAWRRAAAGEGRREGGLRGIVHAAALVAPRATFAEFERVNVGGTRLAVETARATGARLVHVSSAAVYGRAAAYAAGSGAVAVTEDFPFAPIPEHDFYARTKRIAEEVVRDEAARGGLSAAAIRPNVIYGERDRLFTPRVIAMVRRGFAPQIGPGTNHLSCVYAGNVAAAIIAALDRPLAGFRAYNVTRDAAPELTQREFFTAFAEAQGVRLRFIPVPVPVARLGARLWTGWLRLREPRRYAGLGGAAVDFLVGENPYAVARAQQELRWIARFDARTAIRRAAAGF